MADDQSRPASASAQPPMPTDERRAGSRRRVLKTGAIEFGNEAIPCTIRNLSPHGACIEVNSPLWFPDGFVLAVDGLRHTCRVAWKKGRRIGLRFA
ncbi:PilZ domain-containing protein [Bradyrhizobium uaiense]|nr:PilZ domain-containing protein [Bradyrhizobium uaiense]